MIRYLLLIISLILFASPAWGACTGSSPTWNCTPDWASLKALITDSDPGAIADGDTINVSAGDGTETWTAQLVITKGIKLVGPGKSSLTITWGGAETTAVIKYTPSDYNYAAGLGSSSPSFRVSGFTFDGNATAGSEGIWIDVSASTVAQVNVRIDNNSFTGFATDIRNEGAWGVIDNNTFASSTGVPIRHGNGGDKTWWDAWNGISYGSNQNMYVEDNTFNHSGCVGDCQYGSRYAYRYNTITMTDAASPIFDLHGHGGAYYSCFGGEIYGNNVVSTAGQKFLQQRGGKMIVFNNNCTECEAGSFDFYTQVRQEAYGTKVTDNACVDQDGTADYCAKDGAHWYINDSYHWLNTKGNTTVTNNFDESSTCADHDGGTTCQPPALDTPKAGRDYFTPSTTPAITCGAIGDRPACTAINQTYWATTQSCSSTANMVGVNPSTPISGTLYVCTVTGTPGTWVEKFTPYTYPHPLRGEAIASTISGMTASGVNIQ